MPVPYGFVRLCGMKPCSLDLGTITHSQSFLPFSGISKTTSPTFTQLVAHQSGVVEENNVPWASVAWEKVKSLGNGTMVTNKV